MSNYRILLLLFITIALLCACQSQTAAFEQVEPGQQREQVLAMLGPPDDTQLLVKQSMTIWGPEEEWWHQVEMGTQFLVWTYNVPGGRYQLYFVRGADTLTYSAYIDNNIAYEAQ